MTWWSRTAVAAPVASVWELLVDLDAWPRWGPSVTAAELENGARILTRAARGRVRTPLGLWVPFEVTELVEPGAADASTADGEGVALWSWKVAGIGSTTHLVREQSNGCTVELGAPGWAPAYLPVLRVATHRLAALAERDRS